MKNEKQKMTMLKNSILVVDDEPLILYSLTKALEKDFAKVNTARTGEIAIIEASQHFYDLCFIDLGLPGMDGIESMKRIREISPETRFIVITGRSLDPEIMTYVKREACDFIEKPFTLPEVRLLAVRAVESPGTAEKDCRPAARERRKYDRIYLTDPMPCTVEVHSPENRQWVSIEARILDFSYAGVGLGTTDILRPGNLVRFSNGLCSRSGTVQWGTVIGGVCRSGIKFAISAVQQP